MHTNPGLSENSVSHIPMDYHHLPHSNCYSWVSPIFRQTQIPVSQTFPSWQGQAGTRRLGTPGHPNQCQCDATTERCHQPEHQSRCWLVCGTDMCGHPLPCRFLLEKHGWNLHAFTRWCGSRAHISEKSLLGFQLLRIVNWKTN